MKKQVVFLLFVLAGLTVSSQIYEKNVLKHGPGIYHFPNGDRYEGFWENGYMSGSGVYYFNDGTIIVGSWQEGEMNGYQIQFNTDGTYMVNYYTKGKNTKTRVVGVEKKYTGLGVYYGALDDEGEACGGGIFEWTKGDQKGVHFFGDWFCNINIRQGVLYSKEGRPLGVGTWIHDKREGFGCVINDDGSVDIGFWRNGKISQYGLRDEQTGSSFGSATHYRARAIVDVRSK